MPHRKQLVRDYLNGVIVVEEKNDSPGILELFGSDCDGVRSAESIEVSYIIMFCLFCFFVVVFFLFLLHVLYIIQKVPKHYHIRVCEYSLFRVNHTFTIFLCRPLLSAKNIWPYLRTLDSGVFLFIEPLSSDFLH